MHKSQKYLTTSIYPGTPSTALIVSHILSASEARKLKSSLKEDAVDYLYSAAVSLGDALCGATRNLFTWATVKLYYSVFYAMRARLALKGFCLFYIGKRPFSIFSEAGQLARKEEGQTHKLVMKLFGRHDLDHFMLSQPIGVENPLKWLMDLREDANYRNARFIEPNIPQHFIKLSKNGIRKSCQAYLCDKSALYLFDPDHAILAYPLSFIERTFLEFQGSGLSVQKKDDMSFIQELFSDEKGPLSILMEFLSI